MKARWLLLAAGLGAFSAAAGAADWPQWRGPNRDAKVTGFTAPATWPQALTQRWKVTVGEGVATPALVGDKLYVFSRQGADEVTRCLDAATGKELWQDKYEAQAPTRPGSSPARSSPAALPRQPRPLRVPRLRQFPRQRLPLARPPPLPLPAWTCKSSNLKSCAWRL